MAKDRSKTLKEIVSKLWDACPFVERREEKKSGKTTKSNGLGLGARQEDESDVK